MDLMAPIFKIAGIAIASEFVQKAMEEYGQADKTVFVRIAAWVAGGYVAFDSWWSAVNEVASDFGVSI